MIHWTTLDSIKRGECLTCGCTATHISRAQRDIYCYLLSLGVKVEMEYVINGLRYDIAIPDLMILIEYHGLKWHSVPEAKRRDLAKYRNATNHKYDLICIFEDEWRDRQFAVKALLANKVQASIPVMSVRPNRCNIRHLRPDEANCFYDQHHYIGACHSGINYGVMLGERIVACATFRPPNRQSRYDYELVRMTSISNIRVHGIWSKILAQFIHEFRPKSIVSFSDNRLFSGGVYKKIGFRFDGNVPPDYYWTKHRKRFNKSGLRKPPGELRTETELRTSQGYAKMWDLGKKRWVLDLESDKVKIATSSVNQQEKTALSVDRDLQESLADSHCC
jgi:hypothetical protein